MGSADHHTGAPSMRSRRYSGAALEAARIKARLADIQLGLVLTRLYSHMERYPKEMLGINEPLPLDDIAGAVRFALRESPSNRLPPRGQEL
jgi:hypothetical protein